MGAKICICKQRDTFDQNKRKNSESSKRSEEPSLGSFITSDLSKSSHFSSSRRMNMELSQKLSFYSSKYSIEEEKCHMLKRYKRGKDFWKDQSHSDNQSIQNLFSVKLNEEPIEHFYKLGHVFGSGDGFILKEAASIADPSFRVAVKVYKLNGLTSKLLSIAREVSALRSFDHPSFPKIQEIFKNRNKIYVI